MCPRINFDDVWLSYQDGKKIFSGLSLKVGRGEKVILKGRSGLGKSSLFSLLLGFVRPDHGTVFFDGDCVDDKSVWEVRKKVAFIDQDVSVGEGRVADWMTFVAGFKANASLDMGDQRVKDLMTYFELGPDIWHKDVAELSGGERQRVAIVVAVLLDRKVFLLDEVTSALDKSLKEKVAEFFVRENGWTVVVISHDPVWLDQSVVKVFNLEDATWER
ncbi:MAG: energy-coupling factor ABC transporter ATP-binding protein [Candidatus Omnitrophica bacterium]|nr:energy-coupling factor ABC transporter ATP-binding protein [Candidatus Omnitrophota bacterium]